eukprot:5299189-Prymnesium_polylepis.1
MNLTRTTSRLSIPFFYDPNWSARMKALPIGPLAEGVADDPGGEARRALGSDKDSVCLRWPRGILR